MYGYSLRTCSNSTTLSFKSHTRQCSGHWTIYRPYHRHYSTVDSNILGTQATSISFGKLIKKNCFFHVPLFGRPSVSVASFFVHSLTLVVEKFCSLDDNAPQTQIEKKNSKLWNTKYIQYRSDVWLMYGSTSWLLIISGCITTFLSYVTWWECALLLTRSTNHEIFSISKIIFDEWGAYTYACAN